MRTFIIGEIGINHNGDLNIAKKLIDLAVSAGADAVKFQKRDIETVYSKEILDSDRESPWGKTQRDQKMGLEFNEDEYDQIDNYCKEKKIKWFASAWDLKSLYFLRKYKLDYNKIASAMIIDQEFLNEVALEKKHTFISTGMSTTKDILTAVNIFKEKNCPFELMHTVSTYPMKDEDANLKTIIQLKEEFGCAVGYSGHESGIVISLAAVAIGATSLERHITLDRSMYGSDQAASVSPNGFKSLVESCRKIEIALGKPSMGQIIDDEIKIATKLRAHIKNN